MKNSFEALLSNSRYLVIFAVIASVLTAIGAMYMSLIDVWFAIKGLIGYASAGSDSYERLLLRSESITNMIKAVDGFLLASVLIIFALGLYELFISRIEAIEDTTFSSKVLVVHSLDDLKDRLARVILLILVVKFMQVALSTSYDGAKDVLYLSIGILLTGGAVFLGNLHMGKKDQEH